MTLSSIYFSKSINDNNTAASAVITSVSFSPTVDSMGREYDYLAAAVTDDEDEREEPAKALRKGFIQ